MSDVERVLAEQNTPDKMSSAHLGNNQSLLSSTGELIDNSIIESFSISPKVSPTNLTDSLESESDSPKKTPVTSSLTGGPLGARPLPEVWSDVIESLNHRFDRRVVSGWLKPLVLLKIDRSAQHARVVIRTPNKFVAEHVHHHYRTALTQAFSTALQLSSITIELDVSAGSALASPASALQIGGVVERIVRQKQDSSDKIQGGTERVAQKETASKDSSRNTYRQPVERKSSSEHNLNPRYNFSNFVIGNCNQFAHAAALQVSENLGSTYNPLFIYGGVGLGKTHLVNSIGNAAVRRGKQVLMISSESFVNELISSLRANRMQEFKQKFRSLDLLIIDDIQFMIGKERTQEEFFHTFNELHQKHKQIILTSDKLPQELVGVEERLRTRFASGCRR